jgi:hypothetical protein
VHAWCGRACVIDVQASENATENEKELLTSWGGIYTVTIGCFDEKTGTFETIERAFKDKGQVAGTILSFANHECSGTFTLSDNAVLTGTLGCRSPSEGRFTGNAKVD